MPKGMPQASNAKERMFQSPQLPPLLEEGKGESRTMSEGRRAVTRDLGIVRVWRNHLLSMPLALSRPSSASLVKLGHTPVSLAMAVRG